MSLLILLVAVLTLAVGATAFGANPYRWVNRAFITFSFGAAAWLFCVYMAMRAGLQHSLGHPANPVPWLRSASAVGAFLPFIVWLMKESVLVPDNQRLRLTKGAWGILGIGCVLAALCYTSLYIPPESHPGSELRGPAYHLYTIVSLSLYLFLIFQTYRQWLKESGIRRLELQFITFNAGVACFLAIAITAAGNYLNLRILSRFSPLVILVLYALTAWAITIHRVFDARQVFLSIAHRIGLISLLATGTYMSWRFLGTVIPSSGAIIVSIAIFSSLSFWLERVSKDWFRLSLWQSTAATRQAALEIARREPDPNKLVSEFELLLRSWCQTNYSVLLFDSGEIYASGDVEFAKDRSAYAALCKQGWSTPESLQRLRPEPGLTDLRHFLTEHSLGVIVTAPRGSPAPSLLLALGTKINHRPYTYPEVQQVQEIAEFMDNILARSRLSMQARQSEQLATIGLIGASLAHEIRNPLVSIKTFSHLLQSRYDDPEFRRRFSMLIPAEVERIDSLTQQLLDLSNPRRHQMDRVSLHTVVQETSDLMLTRAQEARVAVTMQLNAPADTIWADASAIRQVLINLLINAFQALESIESDRRVAIRSRNSPNGSVILEVSDNGPGIPPEQRSRLFHPFVSTKTKGMGLGLAVCADILHEHRATIIVPDVGRPGATFRVTFPCPPLSS